MRAAEACSGVPYILSALARSLSTESVLTEAPTRSLAHSLTRPLRCRYVSTRNVLFCQDVLPPRSRQVLFILSVDIAKKRHAAGLGFSARMVDGAGGDFAHVPALANLGELEGLHTPLPIYSALEGAEAEREESSVGGVDTTSLADSLRSLMGGGGDADGADGGAEAATSGAAGSAPQSLSSASTQRAAAAEARASAAAASGVAAPAVHLESAAADAGAGETGAGETDAVVGRKRSRASDAVPAAESRPALRAASSAGTSAAAALPVSLASAAERDAFDLVRKIVDNLLTKIGAKYRRLPRTNTKLVRVLFSCDSAVRALVQGAGFVEYEGHYQFEDDVGAVKEKEKLEVLRADVVRLLDAFSVQ